VDCRAGSDVLGGSCLGHTWGMFHRTTRGTSGLSRTPRSCHLSGEMFGCQSLPLDWFFPDTEEVTGSNPVAPTTVFAGQNVVGARAGQLTSWLGRAGAARHPGPPSSWAFEASPLGPAGSTTTTQSSCASGAGQPPAASDPGQGVSLVGQQPSAAAAAARARPGPGPRPATGSLPDRSIRDLRSVACVQAPAAVDGAARVRSKSRRTQPPQPCRSCRPAVPRATAG
jgi:hypothetical protein